MIRLEKRNTKRKYNDSIQAFHCACACEVSACYCDCMYTLNSLAGASRLISDGQLASANCSIGVRV